MDSMRPKHLLAIAGLALACGTGVAVAAHPQVDPTTVPEGFLAAHTTVNDISAASVARALRSGRADLFIEHVHLDAGEASPFHTHPGPAFVAVQRGSLRVEEDADGSCRRKSYGQGRGFADGARRRVHRVVAGASGVDFYEVYLLPRRTGPHQTGASTPSACR
jgi:hypothetical protein